jgi:hypothetical protein
MRTDTKPTITASIPAAATHNRSSESWLWRGVGVAALGLVAGLALGINSYLGSQQEIDGFARASVPGGVSMQVDELGPQVVYFEGDESVIDNLVVAVADSNGTAVAVEPYEAELIYETTDLTLGRAIASFDAEQTGAYDVEVRGTDSGQFTVGESVARLALPGVLAGLAIAGLSVVAGFSLWLYSILRR